MKLKNALKQSKEQTKTCIECFKDFKVKSFRNVFAYSHISCDKCFNLYSPKFYTFYVGGKKCLSLYDYDENFKSKLFQFKGCYDVALAPSFLDTFAWELKIMFMNYIIVPVPSWVKDDEERGFNHVEEIFQVIGLKMVKLFIKVKEYKQSDQSFENRKEINAIINLIDNVDIKYKNVLLVDDVITSGNTIKRCINLLVDKGIKNIKILTLSVSKHHPIKKENMLRKAFLKLKKLNKVD